MRLLIFAFLLLGFAQCTPSQDKKFKPEGDMKKLSAQKDKEELKIGQKAYYQTSVHGSVGETVEVSVDNPSVLKLVDTHFAYDDARKAKTSGGDAGTKTFVFEALKPGSTTIVAKKLFRDEVKNTHKFTINVK